MNDFSDLEDQLKAMRPVRLTDSFLPRLEKALEDAPSEEEAPDNVIRPDRFRFNWTLGIGLAVAATLLILVRVNFRPSENAQRLASISPQPAFQSPGPEPVTRDALIPSGSTQVVYHRRDDGLLFPATTEQPVRRVVSLTKETLQWRNPTTGASLQVSYPSEQVELIPVTGL
jgi:hypothetical protein